MATVLLGVAGLAVISVIERTVLPLARLATPAGTLIGARHKGTDGIISLPVAAAAVRWQTTDDTPGGCRMRQRPFHLRRGGCAAVSARRVRTTRPTPPARPVATTAGGATAADVVAGAPFPEARCEANRGRRHDHLPLGLRLRRNRVDHRRRRRRGPRLLRGPLPRRRAQAQRLDGQLPDHRRRRRPFASGDRSARSSTSPRPTRRTSSPSPSRAARRSTR